ncbi:MAG: ABC transporter ATP-binding protein [Eubacteriaceae bacterium]|nr:ABC transporter ATP-binding protein [Eubacteriaceae bacterium]
MSKIVNIGIQQNGIDSTAPAAVSESGMALITTFMTDEEKTFVNDNYTLVNSSDRNEKGQAYIDLYPKAEDKLYIKNEVDKTVSENLDNAFGTATGTMMYVMKDFAEKSGQSTGSNSADNLKEIDLSKLYQMQPMLNMLPKQTIADARNEAITNDATILNQMGIYMTKAFYSELGIDVSHVQSAYIIRIGLLMLAIALLGGAATILVSLLSSRIAAGVAKNLRKDVFTKIEKFSPNEFGKFSTASLITRCTNDITQIQLLLMIGIRMICYAPIMATGGIIMALKKSVSMSWIIAVAVIALVGIIMIVMAIALPKFKIMQQLVDKLNLVSRENLSGMMVIRAFVTQQHEKDRFDKANDDITKTQLFIGRSMVSLMTGIMLIMNCITLVIVWVGAHQIASSSMQVGDMMAFMQYAMQIIMSFMMISMMFIFVPRAAVSAGRISEVLAVNDLIKDPQKPKAFDKTKKGLVEFKNVFFRYDNADEDALCDITFTAKPGQTTAIIG